ncbi:hypothetical protein GTA08_BOTSDO00839 [Neofusicoccum parvum]|uniref:Uncharacterized protein n=1 Tax=Neofusicoccum parvum TaxID=310453 RepID=A0ACB5SCM0_9PEZI|nr:hypothetical protein GTA08_BOTSDO00839 [Neofusicoccum parvum]
MAVIKQLRGLHVTIACQKEYADVDEEQAKGTVTKYIEAVSGKSFKSTGALSPTSSTRNEDNRDIHKKGLAESVQSLGEISVHLWREQLAAAGDVKKEGNVKRERPSNDDGDVEGRRKRRRSATLLPVEILDLTSDD